MGEDYFTSGHIEQAYTHVLAPPPPPIDFKHNFTQNLSFDTQSVENSSLQTALQIDGEFPMNVNPTGYYGTITANAVLKFRLKYGISSTSDKQGHSVGPLTRTKLNELFNK